MQTNKGISKRAGKGLDCLNFLLADVRDGIGPFLGIYLLSDHHWNLRDIGSVTSVMTLAGVIAQTPAGAFIDKHKNKHQIITIATLLVGISTVIIIFKTNFLVVSISQAITGIAAAFIGPAVTAITLGIAGYEQLEHRTGRNEMFNHGGNVFSALLSGLIGYYLGLRSVFIFTFFLSVISILPLWFIDKKDIDHDLARGNIKYETKGPGNLTFDFLKDRLFIVFTVCSVLFHFANGAMLPLAGEYIAATNHVNAAIYMSACIIIAQLVMTPVAAICGKRTGFGRKPLMIICFAALPVRGLLYTLSSNPFYITSVQVLDGLAGGIFGVVSVLTIADITKGSGRFNFANGVLTTAVGTGASLSAVVAGFIAHAYSIRTSFLFLSAVAATGCIIYIVLMKETNPVSNVHSPLNTRA